MGYMSNGLEYNGVYRIPSVPIMGRGLGKEWIIDILDNYPVLHRLPSEYRVHIPGHRAYHEV